LFNKSDESQNDKADEYLKKTITARVLAESEPRLAVIRKSFDEKRKTFRSSIRVDEVRHLKSFFSLSVSDGGSRVAIIDCADDMNTNAANALLKTLEEPPKNTVFLLISHNPQSLLPTIKSRCRELRLSNLTENDLISALRRDKFDHP
jgi:DNA polymerase-3 subunit delta'